MKVLKISGTTCHAVGLICDRCKQRVNRLAPPVPTRLALDSGSEISGPMTLDMRNTTGLHRADLCAHCGGDFLAWIAAFSPSFRQICTSDQAQNSPRVYRYQSIDAESGQILETTSLFDEDIYQEPFPGVPSARSSSA